MEDRVEEKVDNRSFSGSIPTILLHDHVPIMDTEIVFHVATIVDVLIVSSFMHDYIAMMDIELVSSFITIVDASIAPPSTAAVDTCLIFPLTTIRMDSPIVNRAESEGCEHIALRIEEVVDDIDMESLAKIVERSIFREGPYEREDMVAKDCVMPIPSDLGYVVLKRIATTPMTLEKVPLKVPKIETKVGGPSASSRWWDSK